MHSELLSEIEKRLLKEGYDKFSFSDKNFLIMTLSKREKKLYSEITEEYIFNHHKNLKITLLSEECEKDIIAGFTSSNGHIYRTNRDDQVNMIGKKDELYNDKTIENVQWKTEDEGYISHTREEWLKVYIEAFKHKESVLLKYNDLKQIVLNTKTHQEIFEVKWIRDAEKGEINSATTE